MSDACRGHQQVTGLSATKTLTLPSGTRMALLQAETQDIRYTLDGTTPSSTNGLLLTAGDYPTPVTVEAGLPDAKFIETTASAKLNATYFGTDF